MGLGAQGDRHAATPPQKSRVHMGPRPTYECGAFRHCMRAWWGFFHSPSHFFAETPGRMTGRSGRKRVAR
eukprot:2524068-Alexandrium_andersonii.AAC.1